MPCASCSCQGPWGSFCPRAPQPSPTQGLLWDSSQMPAVERDPTVAVSMVGGHSCSAFYPLLQCGNFSPESMSWGICSSSESPPMGASPSHCPSPLQANLGLPLGTHQASIPATILVYQSVSYSPVSTCCELLIGGCTSLIFDSSAPSTAPAQGAPGHVVRKLSLPSFLLLIRRRSKVWGGGELKCLPPEIGCLAICTPWATVTVVFLCVPTVPIHEQIESELPHSPVRCIIREDLGCVCLSAPSAQSL